MEKKIFYYYIFQFLIQLFLNFTIRIYNTYQGLLDNCVCFFKLQNKIDYQLEFKTTFIIVLFF